MPRERIERIRKRRNAQRRHTLVEQRIERPHRPAMLVIAHTPHQRHNDERGDRARASTAAPRADLFLDQPEQARHHQPRHQRQQHHRLGERHDVPVIPAIGKRHERPHAVRIRVVEQDMAERADQRIAEQQRPARRELGRFAAASQAKAIPQVDDAHRHRGVERHAEKRVRQSPVMLEAEHRPAQLTDHVHVGRFGRNRQDSGRQPAGAIESGAPKARPGQQMCKRIQTQDCKCSFKFRVSSF